MTAPHQHWKFGDTTMQRIVESETPMLSPFEIFTDCTQAHLDANRGWLQPRFQDPNSGLLTITIQSFLLRQNGLTILVDSCSGNDKAARERPVFRNAQWLWLQRLAEAGVKPEDIDIVLCSHLHVDHVGWNTRLDNGRWVPTFPKARYLISRREWNHWQAAGMAARSRKAKVKMTSNTTGLMFKRTIISSSRASTSSIHPTGSVVSGGNRELLRGGRIDSCAIGLPQDIFVGVVIMNTLEIGVLVFASRDNTPTLQSSAYFRSSLGQSTAGEVQSTIHPPA